MDANITSSYMKIFRSCCGNILLNLYFYCCNLIYLNPLGTKNIFLLLLLSTDYLDNHFFLVVIMINLLPDCLLYISSKMLHSKVIF